jgi:hypothetical protein
MRKIYPLGRLAGLDLSARASTLPAFILIWILSGLAAFFLLDLPIASAILGGLLAALLHYASELWHQLGHAAAARSQGHPMSGIQYWGPLSTSLYPKQEGRLPAAVHIRRALGGPVASFLLAIVSGILAWILRSTGGLAWWLAVFIFLDNLLVLSLGALLPLGFNDGSTLLYWGRQR